VGVNVAARDTHCRVSPERPFVGFPDPAWGRSHVKCYLRDGMRGLMIAVLAFLVVFQSSWALAAPYCQHERTLASGHFGHHEHVHEAPATFADIGDPPADPSPVGHDVDCSACHASSPAIVLLIASAPTDPRQSEQFTRVPTASPAPLAARIERPNWLALA